MRLFSLSLLVLLASSTVACNRDSLAGGGDAGVLVLPFDPVVGCRNTSTAACTQCCTPSGGLDDNGGCTIQRTNSTESTPDPCPSSCPPCARCSETAESSLADAGKHARPDCDCPTVDPGIDPCFSPQGCGCFCVGLAHDLDACPQLGAGTCGHGNHCGAILVAAPGPYVAGDEVEALWINLDSRTAFLDACGNVGLEILTGAGGATVVPPSPCASADATVALAQGQSWPVTLTVVSTPTAWAALRASYYLGCSSGALPSPATCSAGPIEVAEGIVVLP